MSDNCQPSRPVLAPAVATVLSLLLIAAPGCYTTDAARRQAKALSVDVDAFHEQQRQRVDRLNREYRFAYARLVEEMTAVTQDRVAQLFDLDAQAAADRVLTHWETETLPKAFRDSFATSLLEERTRLLESDAQLNATRDAYADAYRTVELDLAKLDTVRSHLQTLSADEDQLRTATDFIQKLAKIYKDLRDESEKKQGATGAAKT